MKEERNINLSYLVGELAGGWMGGWMGTKTGLRDFLVQAISVDLCFQ